MVMDGTQAQILLQATGLSKSFGAVRVLHDVSFDVRMGEVLRILGPNGAGKTTLFNLVSGDLRNDTGALTFAGKPLGTEPPYIRCKLGIGRTFQIPKPYGGMTTFENLLVAAMFGGGRTEQDRYAFCKCILHECELLEKANKPAGSLTLLARKRLELARALGL
jgi:branched-chain amino acid transport system ATP-binding protein